MKIMVIGGGGQLGSKIISKYKEEYDLYASYLTRKPYLKEEKSYELDKTHKEEVNKILNKIKPDIVIDTAALHNVDYCERNKNEARSVNVDGSINVAESCEKIGAKCVFISTDYVFNGIKGNYTETDRAEPVNYYGESKYEAENAIAEILDNHLIIRPSVIYSWISASKLESSSGKPINFAMWLYRKLKNNQKVTIVTDQYGSPTLADNLAETIMILIEQDLTGMFHVVGKTRLNRYEFSVKLASKMEFDTGLIVPITSNELNQFASRPYDSSLDTLKAEKVNGVKLLDIDKALTIFKNQSKK